MSAAGDVSFRLGSYDEPLPRSYNLILGIESLIHSADPRRTIANLAQALRPGGTFIIVDDMPVEERPRRGKATSRASSRCGGAR